MKALTEIQPWGTAIMRYGKGIENRSWPPPQWLVGQRFAVHAGKRLDAGAVFDLQACFGLRITVEECPRGAILGTVKLAGYVLMDDEQPHAEYDKDELARCGLTLLQIKDALDSRWRAVDAKCLWVLSEPRVFREPIPCTGAQGLWNVPAAIAQRIEAEERNAHG